MTDSVYRARSLGAPASGLKDQYADGKAAKLWEVYIGDTTSRTKHYKKFITQLLKDKGCHNILDIACGTGVDSIMLLEEGFRVSSVDSSDKMLKYAKDIRWNRRSEPAFSEWVIDEANWLTLPDDIRKPGEGFDALVCLGNSFPHLPVMHSKALSNFAEFVKPGGYLLIDHRNYDHILDYGETPTRNIYYSSDHIAAIQTSVLYVDGKANMVTLDYTMNVDDLAGMVDSTDSELTKKGRYSNLGDEDNNFRLSYYPHRKNNFRNLLAKAFPKGSKITTYGDFKYEEDIADPAFYIHLVEKAA